VAVVQIPTKCDLKFNIHGFDTSPVPSANTQHAESKLSIHEWPAKGTDYLDNSFTSSCRTC
jgi:hypothetical protein